MVFAGLKLISDTIWSSLYYSFPRLRKVKPEQVRRESVIYVIGDACSLFNTSLWRV
ncbi:hypothetical protein [Peribacillus simplex]|uniref:hypothetical protein n=1 Tax=Peribacillus simplex TaxID=1478 RepID=UPI0037CB8929